MLGAGLSAGGEWPKGCTTPGPTTGNVVSFPGAGWLLVGTAPGKYQTLVLPWPVSFHDQCSSLLFFGDPTVSPRASLSQADEERAVALVRDAAAGFGATSGTGRQV